MFAAKAGFELPLKKRTLSAGMVDLVMLPRWEINMGTHLTPTLWDLKEAVGYI
jgi:hypothetical protein